MVGEQLILGFTKSKQLIVSDVFIISNITTFVIPTEL